MLEAERGSEVGGWRGSKVGERGKGVRERERERERIRKEGG